jgi:hypothetical protein
VPYLKLIADITNKRDAIATRAEVHELFQKRNQDKRLLDWSMLDGDGKMPVRWDFREASIMFFAENRTRT